MAGCNSTLRPIALAIRFYTIKHIKMKLNPEIKSALIILGFFLLVFGAFTLFVYSVNHNCLKYILIYIIGLMIILILRPAKYKRKIFKIIDDVLFAPLSLFLVLFRLIMPGMTLIIHTITFLFFVLLIPLIFKILYQ